MLSRILGGYLKTKAFFYVVYISVAAVIVWDCTSGFTGVMNRKCIARYCAKQPSIF